MNKLVKLKRRFIPPCRLCKWHVILEKGYGEYDFCNCEKGKKLFEKLSGVSDFSEFDCHKERGTKYCHFERKEQ